MSELPIIYCNEGFCELTGYSRAELVQRHCSCDFLCGQGTSEAAKLEIKNALKSTEEKHIEILYYRKDGKTTAKPKIIQIHGLCVDLDLVKLSC